MLQRWRRNGVISLCAWPGVSGFAIDRAPAGEAGGRGHPAQKLKTKARHENFDSSALTKAYRRLFCCIALPSVMAAWPAAWPSTVQIMFSVGEVSVEEFSSAAWRSIVYTGNIIFYGESICARGGNYASCRRRGGSGRYMPISEARKELMAPAVLLADLHSGVVFKGSANALITSRPIATRPLMKQNVIWL